MTDPGDRVLHQYEVELPSLDRVSPEVTAPSRVDFEGNAVAEASYALHSFRLTNNQIYPATASTVSAIKAPGGDVPLRQLSHPNSDQ